MDSLGPLTLARPSTARQLVWISPKTVGNARAAGSANAILARVLGQVESRGMVGTRHRAVVALAGSLSAMGARVSLFDSRGAWRLRYASALAHTIRRRDEAHVPTKCSQAGQEARLPVAHVDPRRPRDSEEPSSQGTPQAVGLISGIADRREFVRLRSDGLHVRSRDLRCRFLVDGITADLDQPVQIAYSISRKVGNAVVRNRLRRRLRAILSEVFAAQASPPVTSAVVIVLPGAAQLSFADLQGQVLELMKKIEKTTSSAT